MKKSKQIGLGLLAVVALNLTSCSQAMPQRCIDKNNLIVEDEKCEQIEQQHVSDGPILWHTLPHRWYYGGNGGGVGSLASNGTFEPRPGVGYSKVNSFRGGFGSTGRARSGLS
jgi:hypothetical protein